MIRLVVAEGDGGSVILVSTCVKVLFFWFLFIAFVSLLFCFSGYSPVNNRRYNMIYI